MSQLFFGIQPGKQYSKKNNNIFHKWKYLTSESRLLQQLLKVIIMTSISFSFFFFLWARLVSDVD